MTHTVSNSTMRRPLSRAASAAAFVVAALVLYRPALDVFFCMDDMGFLRQAADLAPWPDTLDRLISARGFFTLGWRLFGADPTGYHVLILALHGLGAWLVTRVGRGLGLSTHTALIAGLLHLVSPAAFTSLHWLSGGQEVIYTAFALLTVLCAMRGGAWAAAAVPLFGLTLLCKEAGVFLLPALGLVLPLSRRARLGMIGVGLVVGFAVLVALGSLAPKPAGSPYETAYGLNVLETLLRHIAWVVRAWEFNPERLPAPASPVWPWGLAPPLLLAALAWRKPTWRGAILRASLVFLALLAPVLPLIRHSKHYYMLAPLIPIWLLAAAGLGRLPDGARRAAWLAPLFVAALTLWQGHMRRTEMRSEHLFEDVTMRYAALVEGAVTSFREAGGPQAGRALILTAPAGDESVHMTSQDDDSADGVHVGFVFLERALVDVGNLRLFFPDLVSVRLTDDLGTLPDAVWSTQELYLNTGLVDLRYLGRGIQGAYKFAHIMYHSGRLARARREIERILTLHPGRPELIADLGRIAWTGRDQARLDEALARLEALAGDGPRAEEARRELAKLRDELEYGP